MPKLAIALLAAAVLFAAGCTSDRMTTASTGASPQDHSNNAPAYPDRPGIRQSGFER